MMSGIEEELPPSDFNSMHTDEANEPPLDELNQMNIDGVSVDALRDIPGKGPYLH